MSEDGPTYPRARRAFAVVMLGLGLVLAGVVVKSILASLWSGPPAPEGPDSPVSLAELSSCADELAALEVRARAEIAKHFGASPDDRAPEWLEISEPLDDARLAIQARCGLDDPVHPVAESLAIASSELEEGIRGSGFLWDRYRADARLRMRATHAALEDARRRNARESEP